jgi:hypothetical protein
MLSALTPSTSKGETTCSHDYSGKAWTSPRSIAVVRDDGTVTRVDAPCDQVPLGFEP